MTNGAKLSLLQSADYASGTTSLSAPHPPHPHTLNQPQQQLVGNGVAGSGGGGGGGGRNGGQGNGRRSLKRSHEESMQQERSDGGGKFYDSTHNLLVLSLTHKNQTSLSFVAKLSLVYDHSSLLHNINKKKRENLAR